MKRELTLEDFRRVMKDVDNDLVRTNVAKATNPQLEEASFRSLSLDSLDAADVMASLEQICQNKQALPDNFMQMSVRNLLDYFNS